MAATYTRRRREMGIHPDARPEQFADRITRPKYDLQTVKEAIGAAIAAERYDTAQQVMEASGYDLCVFCVAVAADDSIELPSGDWVAACQSCGAPYQP